MALRMDSGVHHGPTHHRTALPKRTSPPEADTSITPATRTAATPPSVAGRHTVAVTRRKAGRGGDDLCAKGNRSGGGVGTAGSAGNAGGEAMTASASGKGIPAARESSKRSGGGGSGSGSDGGGGGREGTMYSVARKRVRIVNGKLGDFVVLLQPYNGDHNDICEVCDKGGPLLCCDFCNLVYHLNCAKLTKEPTEELWICPACTKEVTTRQVAKRRRMAEDGSRAVSPGPGLTRHERPTIYHGVKAENDAFRAIVMHKNQSVDIGLYPTAEDAARAYDRKAMSLFGDAAVCNFPADEQMEVEGVGADGNTVKGVVRSFHQWRAEMQWGNKKRHLGFFERLDHASYAYNRAALYMNGPDTPLNPIKEEYVGPPLTGLSVRVPRNKLFYQQLPLPLVIAHVAGGANDSLEVARRRRQMAGQYHAPSVGDNNQVSHLPPLPPPSRPWAGRPLSAPTPPEATTIVVGTVDGFHVNKLNPGDAVAPPQTPSSRGTGVTPTSMGTDGKDGIGPVEEGVSEGTVDIVSVDSVVSVSPSGDGSMKVEEDVETLSPSPPSPPLVVLPSRPVAVYACPGLTVGGYSQNEHTAEDTVPTDGSGQGDQLKVEEGSPTAYSDQTMMINMDPETPDTTTSAEATTPSPGVTPTAEVASEREVGESRRAETLAGPLSHKENEFPKAGEVCCTVVGGVAMSVRTGLPSTEPYLEEKEGAALADVPGAADANTAGGISSLSICGDESTADDMRKPSSLLPPKQDSTAGVPAASFFEISCSSHTEGQADMCRASHLYPSRATDSVVPNVEAPTAKAAVAPEVPSTQSVLESSPLQMPARAEQKASVSEATPDLSTAPFPSPELNETSSAAATNAVITSVEKITISAGANTRYLVGRNSATLPWSSTGVTNEAGAGRKRKLPSTATTTRKASPCPARSGPRDVGGITNTGNDNTRFGPTVGITTPDLSLDDVAELVWDPRGGPRPRGIESPTAAEARAGGKGAVDGGSDTARRVKIARLEKAVWDRDSTLLERVAPAHLEKAMQVLQTCRHDVERAAQMLTVRHGIQVEGLGIRQTRHSRAEQKQQSSNCSRRPNPIGQGLVWRGGGAHASGGGSGNCGGGTGGSGGAGCSGGWQPGTGVGGGSRGAGGSGRKADAQGCTREETKAAGDAFMRHGRDLNAVKQVLGWRKGRVVEYYYCVWKFSPAYQVWKATRHQAGLPGVGSGAGGSQSSSSTGSAPSGNFIGGGLLNASSDGMRWRGSRLRTLKTGSGQ